MRVRVAIVASVRRVVGTFPTNVVEAPSTLMVVEEALWQDFQQVEFESDYLKIVSLLKLTCCLSTNLVKLMIILKLDVFVVISFGFVPKKGNRVAYYLTHFTLFIPESKILDSLFLE